MDARDRVGSIGRQVAVEPRRFYDGGTLPTAAGPGEPPDPGSDPRIVLERKSEEGVEKSATDLQTFSSSETALDEDDELGRQATVIRKGRSSSSDSDVRLVLDEHASVVTFESSPRRAGLSTPLVTAVR